MQGPVGFGWFGQIVTGAVGGGGTVGTGGGDGGYTDPGTGDIGHGGGGSIEPGLGGGPSIAPVEGWEGETVVWPDPGIGYEDIAHWGHMALDVIGVFDPFGVADFFNGVWYTAEGNYLDAGTSFAGIIPVIGDIGKLGKYGLKISEGIAGIGAIMPWHSHHIIPREGLQWMQDNVDWFTDELYSYWNNASHNRVMLPELYHIAIHNGWFGQVKYNERFFQLIHDAGGFANPNLIHPGVLQSIKHRLMDEYNLY